MLDRTWMKCERVSKEFMDGAREFLEFAASHVKDGKRIACPCQKCLNGKYLYHINLLSHLICYGIDQSYTCWTKHGETYEDHLGGQV